MKPRDVAAHLQASCAAIYEVFGEAAPTFSNDDFVVRAHELSRAFGAKALQFRAHSVDVAVEPLAIIESVLREAVMSDQTGAMALFALISVVGPRLLVSTRDARTVLEGDTELGDALDELANRLVKEIRRTAEVVRGLPEGDERWLETARGLTIRLEVSGNAESFGLFA